MSVLVRLILVALILVFSDSAKAESRVRDPYAFLAGSRWYIPKENLDAISISKSEVAINKEQMVWVIDSYRGGYFTGRAVGRVYHNSHYWKACHKLAGSVTPLGGIQVKLHHDPYGVYYHYPVVGNLFAGGSRSRLLMQLAADGISDSLIHWFWMDQCKSGEACETRLPGTTQSLAEYLAACP